MKTIEALQSGRSAFKWVVLIEGIGDYVLSDATQAACVAALSATDWTDFTRMECFVELNNESKLELLQPFTTRGSCRIRVHDRTDAFATYLNRRLYGAETVLTETIDRDATTINVKGTTNFTASGEIHIGTECVGYSSKGGTSFTVSQRGLYSPFGTESTGSGGDNFGNHHRVPSSATHTQLPPLVTQLPRTWLGRRVGVWMHTVDGTGTLNSKADAQLVFAGRIASIADDPDQFHTILELEHLADTDVKNATIGRDLLQATIAEGMYMRVGRTFSFRDTKIGTGANTASDLEVVAGAPASAYEMQEGFYTVSELCEKLNGWLATATGAGDLYGHYHWQSPVTSGADGLRTKCYFRIEHASDVQVKWQFSTPIDVAAFLGLIIADPDPTAYQRITINKESTANLDDKYQGTACPFASCVFKPLGPGNISQEFGESVQYQLDDVVGAFVDQYDLLPYAVKPRCIAGEQWGIFLLDEKIWMVGAYDDSDPTDVTISDCFIAPFTVAGDGDAGSLLYMGRRLDEPDRGPLTIRQVLVLEQTFANLMLKLAYSSGTAGYNHGTYDTLGYGLGWNMPGWLLGPEFDRSVGNMPGAQDPMVVVVDEPTKFCDLFTDDLNIRWAFLRWRDQGFEFGEWKTPVASMAAKSYAGETLEFTEANKAESDPNANHRIASIETSDFVRPVFQFDYCRDFGTERGAKYLKTITVQDQRAVDDAGGGVKPFTFKLRHTFHVLSATGAAVEKLIKAFIERINLASKAGRKIVRTIDQRYFEGYSVGDVGPVTDSFARDPISGERGIAARPAMITGISCSPGGPSPTGGSEPAKQYGRVELQFLDVQRGRDYAPCAEVDDTASNGGYNAGLKRLTCYSHKYSNNLSGLGLRRGGTTTDQEDKDAWGFDAGHNVLIVEMDPADPANPIYWECEVESQSGDNVTLTVALSAPAWDATKKYRIVPQKYSQVVAAQQDVAYQADDTDEMVEDETPPWHYSAGGKGLSFDSVDGTELAELIPDVAFGDGRPYDPGFDHAFAFGFNGFIDRKSAHQSPFLMSDAATSQTAGPYTDIFRVLYVIPYFLGTEHPTATIRRTLTVAPLWRDNAGGQDPLLRVSIARRLPGGDTPDNDYLDLVYAGESAQTATWTTSSTTWTHDTEKTLEINCKDLWFGYVWLIVEGTRSASTRGLYKLVEGPRVVG